MQYEKSFLDLKISKRDEGEIYMYGIIIEGKDIYFQANRMYHTDVQIIFDAGRVNPLDYNWLICRYECNYYPFEIFETKRHNYIWLTGIELNNLLKNKHLQFIWGIIVGYPLEITEGEALATITPDILNYGTISLTNGLAEIEIYAIDSTTSKIFSNKEKIIQQLTKSFPTAKVV